MKSGPRLEPPFRRLQSLEIIRQNHSRSRYSITLSREVTSYSTLPSKKAINLISSLSSPPIQLNRKHPKKLNTKYNYQKPNTKKPFKQHILNFPSQPLRKPPRFVHGSFRGLREICFCQGRNAEMVSKDPTPTDHEFGSWKLMGISGGGIDKRITDPRRLFPTIKNLRWIHVPRITTATRKISKYPSHHRPSHLHHTHTKPPPSYPPFAQEQTTQSLYPRAFSRTHIPIPLTNARKGPSFPPLENSSKRRSAKCDGSGWFVGRTGDALRWIYHLFFMVIGEMDDLWVVGISLIRD